MNRNLEMDNELSRQLETLLDQPVRDPQKTAQGRLAFLEQAQELAMSLPVAVTDGEQPRHIRWMHPLQKIFQIHRKERSPMFGALGTILLMVFLILGGSGATVAAAQNSLPDQALYPVKTWSEDVRTGLTQQPQTRLELALEYSNRRAQEMQTMLRAGQVPTDAVLTRMRAEIDLALGRAAGQPDREAVQSLEQIRQQLQAHEQVFANLGPKAGVPAEALLERTRAMLQDRLQLCDQGIQDPDLLRRQLRERERLHDGKLGPSVPAPTGAGNPWTMTPAGLARTPTSGSGYGPGPGDGNGGNNPWTTGTPTPGSSYGPGPGDGNGGNNPWTTGTPTPGSGYSPGPGPTSGSRQPQNGNGSSTGSDSGSSGCTNCDGGGNGSGSGSGGGSGTGSGGGAGSGSGSGGGRH